MRSKAAAKRPPSSFEASCKAGTLGKDSKGETGDEGVQFITSKIIAITADGKSLTYALERAIGGGAKARFALKAPVAGQGRSAYLFLRDGYAAVSGFASLPSGWAATDIAKLLVRASSHARCGHDSGASGWGSGRYGSRSGRPGQPSERAGVHGRAHAHGLLRGSGAYTELGAGLVTLASSPRAARSLLAWFAAY